MFYRYRFESEIYPELSRIPLHVRMKLDLTGVKLSLTAWLAFSLAEREVLCDLPVETGADKKVYGSHLDSLSHRHFGEKVALVPPMTDPPWEDLRRVPDSVAIKSSESARIVTPEEWGRWNSCQRYALLKLSTSKNEPEQFYRALEEFREPVGEQT